MENWDLKLFYACSEKWTFELEHPILIFKLTQYIQKYQTPFSTAKNKHWAEQ